MIRRPPRSTLFPTRRSSDLDGAQGVVGPFRGQPAHHDCPGQQSVQYVRDRKSTRLNSSHSSISYAVFCLKKKNYPSPLQPLTSLVLLPITFPSSRVSPFP